MKKYHLGLIVACLTSILHSAVAEGQSSKNKAKSESAQLSLDGAWKRIAVIVNGEPETHPLEQMRLFHDGFYTYIGQDSAHNWTRTFGGTYKISGNNYIETTRYCFIPSSVGITHWQEFKLKGDTLSFKLYKKMIDSTGKEMPLPPYTRELVLVREKK